MKYKESYGDKQRAQQKRRKEENVQDREVKPPSSGKSEPEDKQPRANPPTRQEKRTA